MNYELPKAKNDYTKGMQTKIVALNTELKLKEVVKANTNEKLAIIARELAEREILIIDFQTQLENAFMHLEAAREDRAALERRESSMMDVIISLREKNSKLGQQPVNLEQCMAVMLICVMLQIIMAPRNVLKLHMRKKGKMESVLPRGLGQMVLFPCQQAIRNLMHPLKSKRSPRWRFR